MILAGQFLNLVVKQRWVVIAISSLFMILQRTQKDQLYHGKETV